jgi:co-chaperonin GroES (HSP10)
VIFPVLDNVLVKIDVEEKKSQGGLFLVSEENVVKNTGVVEAVGDSEVIKVKPGDRVIFEKGMGRRFEVPVVREGMNGARYTEREEYLLIGYFDVLAVVVEG